jgi:hypothetical protein
MGIGLFFVVIAMIAVLSLLTFIENEGLSQFISFILSIIFMVSLSTYGSLIQKKLPKYHINDKVILPDNTWGNIDSVAYKIEGVWYNQKVLKD